MVCFFISYTQHIVSYQMDVPILIEFLRPILTVKNSEETGEIGGQKGSYGE